MSFSPIIRLLAFLISGIIAAILMPFTPPAYLMVCLCALLALLFIALLNQKKFTNRWIFGIFSGIAFLTLGFTLTQLHKQNYTPTHLSHYKNAETIIAIVNEPLQEKGNSYKTILKVLSVKQNNKFVNANAYVLCYFEKGELSTLPKFKDEIIFDAKVSDIGFSGNPGSFNYKQYMAYQNAYQQTYIKNGKFKILQNANPYNIYKIANDIRDKFLSIMQHSGMQGQEYAVSAALLFGQRDKLDPETVQIYANSGVIHILSVSGMHVGVIYLMLTFLLSFVGRGKWQNIFKTILILSTIWAYALLTGLSPAVLRSAVMFTFISIGNLTTRDAHILNSIAISAFFILLFNPFLILDIGFQLSYLAITGIVLLQKPLAGLWKPKYKLSSWIWDLICVSVAAQIATMPLTLLYFHQFPLYFIPANLIAVPLSSAIIYTSLAVLASSFMMPVAKVLAWMTSQFIYILNTSLDFLNSLPGSLLHITGVFAKESILLFAIIICTCLFFYIKKKFYLFASLSLMLLLFASIGFTIVQRQNQQKFIVYNINKHSALGFINGNQQIIISDSSTANDKKIQSFNINGTQNVYGLKVSTIKTFDYFKADSVVKFGTTRVLSNYMLANNKRIVVINKIPFRTVVKHPLNVDYAVLRNSIRFSIKDLLQYYNPKSIILDASMPLYKEEKVLKECAEMNINAYSIRKNGAFILDL